METDTERGRENLGLGDFGAVLTILACIGFSFAVLWGDGHFDAVGNRYLVVSVLAALGSFTLLGRRRGHAFSQVVGAAALIAAVLEFVALSALAPAAYASAAMSTEWFGRAIWLVFCSLLFVGVGFLYDDRYLILLRRFLMGVGFLIGGIWVLRASPSPTIDVWWVHQAATETLLGLGNPYALSPAIIDTHTGQPAYDAYVYPPVLVLLYAPFKLAFGDVRYASLVASLAIWWAIVQVAQRLGFRPFVADSIGALALLHPRAFFILEQAWTEPVNAALIALAALSYSTNHMKAATWMFGLALFSKQNLVILFPILLFLPGFGWKRALRAGAIAAAVVAPFLLANPQAFWHGVVELPLAADPRLWDSNSIPAYLFRRGIQFPTWVSFVLCVGIAAGGAVWRRASPAGLFATLAASLAVLFAFGRQAFANYYWLTGQLFAVAAAMTLMPLHEAVPVRDWFHRVTGRARMLLATRFKKRKPESQVSDPPSENLELRSG